MGEGPLVLPRVPIITTHARAIIAAADPFRVSFLRASALGTRLATLGAHLTAMSAGKDRSTEIDSELDGVLDELALLSASAEVPGGEAGVVELEAMRAVFLRGEAEFLATTEAMNARLAEMTIQEQTLAARHAELQALVDQATADVATYRTAGAAEVDQIRTANSAALSEFRTAFDATTAESVAAGQAQMRTMLDAATLDQTAQAEAAQAEQGVHSVAAAATLEAIESTKVKVMKLAEALGTGAQSAGWGSYADQQRKAANWMLGGAIGAFLAAAGFAAWLAVIAADTTVTLSWQRIVTKLAVTTAFGLVGGYLASQSGEHRHQERLARRRQLDLLALPLFIAELEDTDRNIIVKALAEAGFLTPEPLSIAKSPRRGIGAQQVSEMIASAVKAATK